MSLIRFSNSFQLPDYLEEALAPFSWSGILSRKFRDDITSCLLASNRKEVTAEFVTALHRIRFLSESWVDELTSALTRFAEEGGFKR